MKRNKMKKLFILIALVSTFVLVSCSENQSPSFITNPSLEKVETGSADHNISSFPYLKLTQFKEVKELKYYSESGVNKLYIDLSSSSPGVLHFYVVIEYTESNADETPSTIMLFVENNSEKVLEIEGFNESLVSKVNVYAYYSDNLQHEINYPFYNYEQFHSLNDVYWEKQKYDINIKCEFLTNTDLAYVQIDTENGSYLLYWGKPANESLIIENFGELEVIDVKLFGRFIYFYDTVNRVN